MSRLLDTVSYSTYAICSAAGVITTLVIWDKQKTRGLYPPGPRGHPVVELLRLAEGEDMGGVQSMAEEHSE